MSSSDLPEFNEYYVEYYDPVKKSFEVRRKSRADSNVSIDEAMEYIDAFLRKYQMTFVPSKLDKSIVFFPFMFIQPMAGDKIYNRKTSETYTVKQVILNPETNKWDGLVDLDMQNPPSTELLHSLDYHTRDKLVRFDHEIPDSLVNQQGANSEGLMTQPRTILPTVTWKIISMEPGTIGSMNSSRKEWKPRLRESVKDPFVPGSTVEIYGQRFETVVQFDCWSNDPRTSDRLVGWFEQFMRLFTGHLRRLGVGQLLFLKRNRDDTQQTWRQSYHLRGSQFLIETEQLEARYSRDILKLDISIEPTTGSISDRQFNETRWIADQMVSGRLTSDSYRNLFYRSGEYLFGNIDLKQ